MTAYSDFLATKVPLVSPAGIPYEDQVPLNKHLFAWQREIVRWNLHLGRSADFEECGLGKSLQELAWSWAIHEHTDRNVLGIAPLAVAGQLVEEGARFDIPVHYARNRDEVKPGINVTNYERIEHFDAVDFEGVFLDESSILKSYMGKTKRALVEKFARTRFRLCGTATPAPNDVMELGNHCEFLGVMDSHEMLTRWFINDTMAAGHYRLKGHAEADFWQWVASWAACVSKPSDVIGADGTTYSDEGYELPGLEVVEHIVAAGGRAKPGELFHDGKLTATTMHQEMRQTAPARAAKAAELVRAQPDEDWLIWCNANYEADELIKLMPEAVEVRGDDTIDFKENAAAWFRGNGSKPSRGGGKRKGRGGRWLISKQSIFGYGLNFQNSSRSAFVGLSYSFEDLYQALRRQYRFGQKRTVQAHIIGAKSEQGIRTSVARKQLEHVRMQQRMAAASREARHLKRVVDSYSPAVEMRLPRWLSEVRP